MKGKVAVVNRTNLKNYGSVLQVYALCEAVRSLGYEPEVVWEKGNLSHNWDIRPKKLIKTGLKLLIHPKLLLSTLKTAHSVKKNVINETKVQKFDEFVINNFIRSFYSYKELKAVSRTDKYLKFVCGSDQIWSSTTLYVDPMMYLRFAPKQKRVAYAPSLGRDYIPNYNRRIMRKYINDIPCVSIREKKGKELIKKLIGKDVPVVLDPTLLLTKEQWDQLKASVPRKPFILCYFLDAPSNSILNKIIQLSKQENLDVISVGVQFPEKIDANILNDNIGPNEFLGLIDEAELIITDSYHGMLFSINYRKRFWSVARNYGQYDQSSRQKTVLSLIGLENRYVNDSQQFNLDEIDYEPVRKIINQERENSLAYLKNSLNS